jgi:hypothetical protein
MNLRNRINVSASSCVVFIVMIATAHVHAQTHQGDIELLLINSRLTTSGGTYTGSLQGRVFEGSFPRASGQTTDPGFDSAAEFLEPGEKIRFDFVREILYWNGTALVESPRSVTVTTLAGSSVTLAPTDVGGKAGVEIAGGDPTTGAFHQHLQFSFGGNAPNGVYGLMMTLGPAGTSTFGSSEPFLIAFSRNASLLNPGAGVDAMAAALVPVPEPSTLGLAAVGVVAGAAWRSRGASNGRKRKGIASE